MYLLFTTNDCSAVWELWACCHCSASNERIVPHTTKARKRSKFKIWRTVPDEGILHHCKKMKKNVSRTVVIWRLSLSGFLSHAGYTHPFQAFSKVSSRYDIRFRLFETCLFKNVIASIYFFLVALGLHCWAWTFLQLRGSGTTICCSAWLLWLQDTGSRHAGLLAAAPPLESMGSAVVAHVLNWPMACGIFSDQGSNPRPLHWQVGSYLLHYQGIPSDASVFFLSSLLQLLLDHPLRSLRSTTV